MLKEGRKICHKEDPEFAGITYIGEKEETRKRSKENVRKSRSSMTIDHVPVSFQIGRHHFILCNFTFVYVTLYFDF